MPVKTGAQYTPEQILEAGRRAESEGRTEYALQFYRHLIDHHRSTREAQYATEALARLEAPRAPAANGYHGPRQSNGGDHGAYHAHHDLGPQLDVGRRSTAVQHDALQQAQHVELPPPVWDYRLARSLARLAAWSGGPVLMLGLSCAAVAVFAPGGLAKVPFIGGLFTSSSAGLSLAAAGLGMLIGGQCVRALLDMANATRDMAAVLRAQAEGPQPPEHDEPPRRRAKKKRRH